jgi:hypothetical protein
MSTTVGFGIHQRGSRKPRRLTAFGAATNMENRLGKLHGLEDFRREALGGGKKAPRGAAAIS